MPDLKTYDFERYLEWVFETSSPELAELLSGIPDPEVGLNHKVADLISASTPTADQREMAKSELEWFDGTKYESARLDSLGISGWTRLLYFRLFLKTIHRVGPQGIALQGFEFMRNDPFNTDLVDPPIRKKAHFTDTPSVTFARAAPLANFVERMLALELDGHAPASVAFMELGYGTTLDTVMLQVDLRAGRTQLRKDFSAWLDKIDYIQARPLQRDFSKPKVFREWRKAKYLQCFDLDLFAELSNAQIPAKHIADILNVVPSKRGESRLDVVRGCRGCHDVFTWETFFAMARQRDAEAQSKEPLDPSMKKITRAKRTRRPSAKKR
jgi:hypothetical protein